MKASCMNRYLYTTVLFLLAGTLSSCTFHRLVSGKKARKYDNTNMPDTSRTAMAGPHVVLPQPDTITAVKDTLDEQRKLITELTPLWKTRLDYKTFSGKAKVHYEGPEDNQEFTAHFRIRKDSLIWIAITGLGGVVQVARIYITPDSFIMVNQLQKEVTRISLDDAAKVLPTRVDFESIQHLLVGDPLRDGVITNASSFGGGWIIQVSDSAYMQRITYNRADSTMRSGELRTHDPAGPRAMIQYGGYEMITGRKLSTNRVLNIQNGNDIHILDMDFQRTDFDQPLDYPISIPASYKRKEIKK